MDLRELGSSGLLVSPICLGTMTFGSPVAEDDAVSIVHGALDQGINFVDTANVYEGYDRYFGSPGGVAENIVGKALKGRRDKAILATKVCAPIGPGPQDRGLSPSHILREVDRSLQRLQTDYIDLYIMHWPDKHTPLETTMAAMEQTVRQGKVRCIGASNHNAAQLCEMHWIMDRLGGPKVVSSQIPYSLLRREFHHDLYFCDKHNIGVTPYQALQGGLLTGKYRRGQNPAADSRAAEKPDWIWDTNDHIFDQLEGLEKTAKQLELPVTQLTVAATLAQPAMSSLIIGVKRLQQLEDAIAGANAAISCETLEALDQYFPKPWHQPDPIRG